MNNAVAGFSKLSKEAKIDWIANEYFSNPNEAVKTIKQYWNSDLKLQQLHDEFIENTITRNAALICMDRLLFIYYFANVNAFFDIGFLQVLYQG